MAAPGPKRDSNLNTVPYWNTSRGKKIKYKNHENFYYRGEIKIVGKETDMQECKECHEILPTTAFTTQVLRSDGAWYLKKICRQCKSEISLEVRVAKRNAPPKPERCDCCHKKVEKLLELDHIHGSTTFRGWLCRACNSGMGKLGDNLEGVLQSAIYLENDIDKIIETLHEVFNEMFARTK
jgi:hypothetical protein